MIKIIKHGKIFKKVCPECGCEFTFETEDLHTDYSVCLTTYPCQYNRYVICPECGKRIHYDTIMSNFSMGESITLTSSNDAWPDCETCPNKPDFSKGIIVGDTPCTWCKKNQFTCVSAVK